MASVDMVQVGRPGPSRSESSARSQHGLEVTRSKFSTWVVQLVFGVHPRDLGLQTVTETVTCLLGLRRVPGCLGDVQCLKILKRVDPLSPSCCSEAEGL